MGHSPSVVPVQKTSVLFTYLYNVCLYLGDCRIFFSSSWTTRLQMLPEDFQPMGTPDIWRKCSSLNSSFSSMKKKEVFICPFVWDQVFCFVYPQYPDTFCRLGWAAFQLCQCMEPGSMVSGRVVI